MSHREIKVRYNKGMRKPLERVGIIIDMIEKGMRDTAIASKSDCSVQNVNYVRLRYGLKQPYGPGRPRKYNRCMAYGMDCSGPPVGRFCRRHYSRFSLGILTYRGKEMRELLTRGRKKEFFGCIVEKCVEKNLGRFCSHHWHKYKKGTINIHGKLIISRVVK